MSLFSFVSIFKSLSSISMLLAMVPCSVHSLLLGRLCDASCLLSIKDTWFSSLENLSNMLVVLFGDSIGCYFILLVLLLGVSLFLSFELAGF